MGNYVNWIAAISFDRLLIVLDGLDENMIVAIVCFAAMVNFRRIYENWIWI